MKPQEVKPYDHILITAIVRHSKRGIRHKLIGHSCYNNAWPQQKGRQHFLLSPLDYPPAKTDGAVNGGRSPFTRRWPARLDLLNQFFQKCFYFFMISIAFILTIIREQTIRQTICCTVLYDANTIPPMILARYFRTNTFFYIFAVYFSTSFQISIGWTALKR